ncbi:MAG: hypothetical protein AB7T38_03560 [Nitrospirales bacterium]
MLSNLFRRTPKLDLDPERALQTYALFDDRQGYQSYAHHCRERFSGTIDSAPGLLTQQGLEHVSILNPPEAGELLSQALTRTDESMTNKPQIDYSDILIIRDKVFLETWFRKIFQTALTAKLTGYFQSHFLIYWYTFLKAKPADQAVRSFLWHCDKGPSAHLKILLYLNDMKEHRGNTIFLDRATTARFAQSGYVFGSVKKRTDDLTELARQEKIPLHPYSWDMKAGEGVAFEPSQVLHRGILPSTGFRYVLAFCLLPSPIPWDQAFIGNNHEGFRADYTWHPHAQDLMKAIPVPA